MREEYQQLAALIVACRDIDTEKLQRLVYLLQRIGAPFSHTFQMGSNGPYSEALEDDLRLLAELALVERVTKKGEVAVDRVVARPRAIETIGPADELTPFAEEVRRVATAPVEVLDFAATLGAWLTFGYRFTDALNLTRKGFSAESARRAETPAVGFFERHGLAKS